MTPNSDYLSEDATVAAAAKRLAEAATEAVPVCDAEGQLTGMVTDRDLVVEVTAAGKVSGETRLIDLIRGEVVTIGVDDTVDDAVATMRAYNLRRLPVVEGKKLVGMLSHADVAGRERR
ncbi:MAG TPA: CBS domain-containing protein [Mycobacteriales bacterium]|nr:CBS domain-containing protein [Mycobacteriales bacterium]